MSSSILWSGAFLFYVAAAAIAVNIVRAIHPMVQKLPARLQGLSQPLTRFLREKHRSSLSYAYLAMSLLLNVVLLGFSYGTVHFSETLVVDAESKRAPHTQVAYYFHTLGPLISFDAHDTRAKHQSGHSYSFQLHSPPPFTWTAPNRDDDSFSSSARVYEDDQRLGRITSNQQIVGETGHGNYTHWLAADGRNSIIFLSASDNTNPQTNNRSYRVDSQLSLTPGTVFAVLLMSLPLYALILSLLSRGLALGSQSLSRRIPSAIQTEHSMLLWILGLAGVIVLISLPTLAAWSSGSTHYSYHAIGGLLPWSDSSGWLHGINHLLREGEIDNWTIRRPLNLVYMSTIAVVAALDLQWMLILRNLILGVAAWLFVREISISFGYTAAIAVLALIASFASRFTPIMMTEVAGLTFGLVAAALLWRGMRSGNLRYYAFGSLLLTIGLAIRTGAVLVLGSAMLWPLIGLNGAWRARFRWTAVTGVTILAGILLTWIWTALLYNGESAPGENFAFSLYGLAHGGLPWPTFFENFDTGSMSEGEQASLAYSEAYRQILDNPLQLLQGFTVFLGNYREHFFLYIAGTLKIFVIGAFCIGLIIALLDISRKEMRFLLLFFLGIVATSAIIFWDYDAYRALIVTAPFDALFVAFAVSALMYLPQGKSIPFTEPYVDRHRKGDIALPACAMLLIAMVTVFPVAGLSLIDKPAVAHPGCAAGSQSALVDIGADSPYIQLVDQAGWAPQVSSGEFASKTSKAGIDIAPLLNSMAAGDILVHGYDLQSVQKPTWLIMSNPLFAPGPGLYAVCGRSLDSHFRVLAVSSAQYLD